MTDATLLAAVTVIGAVWGAAANVVLCRLAGDPVDWRMTAGVAAVSAIIQCVSASVWILSGAQ